MAFNETVQLEMPDSFPNRGYDEFMQLARSVLLPAKRASWQEFIGAANLIAWRFRACATQLDDYLEFWSEHGLHPDFEEQYSQQHHLFLIFVTGVSCIEATSYALYALCSDQDVLGIKFERSEQFRASPRYLCKALEGHPSASSLRDRLSTLSESNEWTRWVSLRNRMTHRSNLPLIIRGSIGGTPPPMKAFEVASTSTTDRVESDESDLMNLFNFLRTSLSGLLDAGASLITSVRSQSSM